MVKEDFLGAVEFRQSLKGCVGEEEGQSRQEKLLSKRLCVDMILEPKLAWELAPCHLAVSVEWAFSKIVE